MLTANMSFRICMIGCGNMALWQHGPACKRYEALHPDTEFIACCDINEEKAKFCKEKLQLPRYYTDIDTMLDNEKPHAVCLIVPMNVTAELACKILRRAIR